MLLRSLRCAFFKHTRSTAKKIPAPSGTGLPLGIFCWELSFALHIRSCHSTLAKPPCFRSRLVQSPLRARLTPDVAIIMVGGGREVKCLISILLSKRTCGNGCADGLLQLLKNSG